MTTEENNPDGSRVVVMLEIIIQRLDDFGSPRITNTFCNDRHRTRKKFYITFRIVGNRHFMVEKANMSWGQLAPVLTDNL
jgi:hypothetical protein